MTLQSHLTCGNIKRGSWSKVRSLGLWTVDTICRDVLPQLSKAKVQESAFFIPTSVMGVTGARTAHPDGVV